VGKYGWGGAYHSTYWVDPAEELVVVYFTQVIPAWGLDDHGKIRALVYAAITDEPAPAMGAGAGARHPEPAGRPD
jgi:CubicO group peptidase (beta-lactamase class C family)